MKKIKRQAILIILTFTMALIMCSAVSAEDTVSGFPALSDNVYVSPTGNDSSGDGSEANPYQTIQTGINAVSGSGTGVVHLAAGTYNGTGNKNMDISKSFTIQGASKENTIIDAEGTSNIFDIYSGTILIKDLTIRNGYEYGYGGAIGNAGNLTIINCNFENNHATDAGGAICNVGTLVVKNSNFSNNNANSNGGAIYNGEIYLFPGKYGSLIVSNCNFTDNIAYYGGAIYTSPSSDLTITGSTFTNNKAERGGAIYDEGSDLTTITGSNFTNNNAEYSGGAIIIHYTLATITGCKFTGNTAGYEGGAIKVCCGSAKITGSTFTDNTAYMGGAIYNGRNLELKYNTLTNNKALMNALPALATVNKKAVTSGYGGGIFLAPYSSYEIIGNHILNNTGCGIYIGYPELRGTNILSNIEEEVKAIINFNRIYGNTPYGIYNNTTEITPNSVSAAVTTPITPTLNAKYNWWGSNDGPNSAGADKTNLESTYYAPWIVMKLTPTKVVINGGETTLLTASFLYDNNGTYHDPANGHIPDGTPVTFTTSLGQVGSQTITTYTINGIATAILRAVDAAGNPVSGIAYITATTDAQKLSTSVSIIEIPEANAATNTTSTVGMQETGIPTAGLILAILALFGGFAISKK